MLDRLRWLANRPIRDSDRLRLFGLVVALIVASVALLALVEDPAPSPTSTAAPTGNPVRTYVEGDSPPATPAPRSLTAPSEESDLPAGRRPRQDDVARSKRAARRFLRQYLAFSYGRAPASEVTAASEALRDELDDARPRVPADELRRRARVELLQTNGVSSERADLLATISDGERRYSVRLQLANTAAGWLVTALER